MADLSALNTPISLLKPATTAATNKAAPVMSASEVAKRAAIKKTATDFEASFLSTMLNQMFEGVKSGGPFGGGAGEEAYKSFMIDGYAKQMAKAGGVGVARAVQHEMLKMQGLS